MDRAELIDYLETHYNVKAEYLWDKYPNYAVFRHSKGDKWFALIMDVPAHKLQIELGDQMIDIVDLKIAPEMIGSLRQKKGIFPAYHMNKTHWISVQLGGTVSDQMLTSLIEESYQLTEK